MKNERFLKACRREPVDRTPIWLMRQAGRYMAEYRAIRSRHSSMLEMIKSPELATEITLQPIEAFDLDAAIIFSDILPLLEGMGLKLEFVQGEGPAIRNPVRTAADVQNLSSTDPVEGMGYTLSALRMTREALAGKVPLIGFSGAPFTLACYAIEGGGSQDFLTARGFMYAQPEAWHALMDKLAKAISDYLRAQVEAGAQALQLFDSWGGLLGPADYREYVQPYSRKVMQAVRSTGVPAIHFATGASGILPLIREAGGDVIGVDWRQDLADAWDMLGPDYAVQGNLDPALLATGPVDAIRRRAVQILESVQGRPGHIFNLGHGILKTTPPEHVAALIETVHAFTPVTGT